MKVDKKTSKMRKRSLMIALLMILCIIALTTVSPQESLGDITKNVVETPHDEYNAVQLPAESGKPVEWVKQVTVTNLYDQAVTEVMVSVPDDAKEVEVVDEDNKKIVVTKNDEDVVIVDTLNFNQEKSYVVKYATPAPEQVESNIVRDGTSLKKQVTVSSDHHYQEVLTKATLPEISKEDIDKVRLFWDLGGQKTDVTEDPEFELMFHDTDADGKYDLMTWVTPHLSTQIFEIIIYTDVDPGTYSDIGITLQGPADGEYVSSNTQASFNYTVSYNSSTTVNCNLTVDGTVLEQNIQTMTDSMITRYYNLSTGSHDWYVTCSGSDGTQNTSETRSFTIDLEKPQVILNTEDYIVSHTNNIDLEFTMVDGEYPTATCSMSVNGPVNKTGISATNDTLETVHLTNMGNGVYNWNVSCVDGAGNLASSEERVFYISQGVPAEYNISSNKNNYAMGEDGYLVIDAPANTNMSLFVSTPTHDSFFEHYIGQNFPLVDTINYTDNSGTYNLDGIFTHAGEMYIVKTSFEVTNSFDADLEANKTTGRPDEEFEFEASSTGGIGDVTYTWDFDDDSTEIGEKVDHKYASIGTYLVELTATDSKGNKATETVEINVYNKYNVTVVVSDKRDGKLLENITVEFDDERKKTDKEGVAEFEVYEGKRRLYIADNDYEWFKIVRNITKDQTIKAELNWAGILTDGNSTSNSTASSEDNSTTTTDEIKESAESSISDAEMLLAKVESALQRLSGNDQAEKSVIETLKVREELLKLKKKLRQSIRDIGNAELDQEITSDEKSERIENITKNLKGLDLAIGGIEVLDTTEFIEYPKAASIDMLSAEYLRYKKLEYSKGEKKKYSEMNLELQKEFSIKSRLSVVKLTLLSGEEKTVSVVTNTVTKKPEDTKDMSFIEYLPKEVADDADEIVMIDDFKVIKKDPILQFDMGLDKYSYYVEKETSLEKLKATKHIVLVEPKDDGKGLPGVTGMSILPNMEIKNPKLFVEILLIALLLIAYLVYHFEIPDKIREWREKKAKSGQGQTFEPYETDMAYKPESRIETFARKAKQFVKKEDEAMMAELSHIRNMISSAHYHAKKKDHKKAYETYSHVKDAYKDLSADAKKAIHPETKDLLHSITISKLQSMLDEAFKYIENNDYKKAQIHYSEIKQLYAKLEKTHRAAVSERCMQLHQKLFETSLA